MSRERALPNEDNCSLEELEKAIECSRSVQSYSRLLGLKALLLGQDFDDVCQLLSVSVRTLERWIEEYNEQGVDGLIDRPRSGRPRSIPAEKIPELRELIENPNLADEHFWTGKKFHGYLSSELQLELSYRTTIRFLDEQDY
jgi:putative transposase